LKKLHILVDCDDVLNYCFDDWLAYLNKRYNLNAKAEDAKSWDFYDLFPSLTKEEVKAPLHEYEFARNIRPKLDNINILKQMLTDGHELTIVTAHNNITTPAKMDWLKENIPFIPKRDVIIAQKKQVINGDVLIDDGVHNLEGGQYLPILYDMPYNRAAASFLRVSNMAAAYKIIGDIANGKTLL